MNTESPANLRLTDPSCRHLRLGVVEVAVRSAVPEVLDDLDALYGECRRPTVGPGAIHIEARVERRRLWTRRHYAVWADGAPVYIPHQRNEVFPHVEWGVNWRVMMSRNEYLQLHAATLVRGGRAILLAGDSGCGKSTLAAGLMARGWTYFCDEFALLDPDTLCVQPFPKALCIKAGAFAAVEQLGLPLRRRHYAKHFKGPVGYIPPVAPRRAALTPPCPVRYVVFPQYISACRPRVTPMPRAEAVNQLIRRTLNHRVFEDRTLPLLCALVRGATCWQLASGPLGETCDVVESALVDDCSVSCSA
jgi:HprK-related kinase A